MRNIVGIAVGLLVAVGIAFNAQAVESTTSGVDDAIQYVAEDDGGGTIIVLKPKGGKGPETCSGGYKPFCYPSKCDTPASTVCPAANQCNGKSTCGIERRWDGAVTCHTYGSCTPQTLATIAFQ